MTPEATFPSSSFSPTSPSLNYNTGYPFNYNLMLKTPRDQYYNYKNPRNDLFPSQPTGLFYSYHPGIYPSSNSYPSDLVLPNRRNLYQISNTTTLPYQNNTCNSFIMKNDFSRPLDNILTTSISEGNPLLSNSLSSNSSLNDSVHILSPLLFSKYDTDGIIKTENENDKTNPTNIITETENHVDSTDILNQMMLSDYTNSKSLKIDENNIKPTLPITKNEIEVKNKKSMKKGKNEAITFSYEKIKINDLTNKKLIANNIENEKLKPNHLTKKMKVKIRKNKKINNTSLHAKFKAKRQQAINEKLLTKKVILVKKKIFF